jgi:sigma-54 specific flagellar transcriptional regulator A
MTCDVRIIAATHRNLEESIARGQFRGDLFYRLNVVPIEVPSLRERIDDLEILIEEFAQQNVRAGRPKLKIAARAVAALKSYTWPGNVRELGNLIERLSVLNGAQTIDILDLPTRYRAGFLDDNAVSQLIADLAVAEPLHEDDFVIDESDDDSIEAPINEAVDAGAPTLDTPTDVSSAADGVIALPEQGLDLKGYLYSIEQKLIQEALARSGGTVSQAARLLGLRRTTLVEKLRRFGMTDADLGD